MIENIRCDAAEFFHAVERGEKILVMRHGKPIAEIIPALNANSTISWKRPGLRLRREGASLSREILKERKRSRP